MTTRTAEREQFLADIITGAIEGGTGYWAYTLRYKWEGLDERDYSADIVAQDELEELVEQKGRKVVYGEVEEAGLVRHIDIDLIAKGLGKIKRGEVGVNARLLEAIKAGDAENDAGDIDADCADVIVQAGLFGEVVYG